MIKRLFKLILIIPVTLSMFIQVPYEIIRWLITGKEFDDPWLFDFVDW